MRNKAFLEKNSMLALISGNDPTILQIITFSIHLKKHVILEAIMFQTQEARNSSCKSCTTKCFQNACNTLTTVR